MTLEHALLLGCAGLSSAVLALWSVSRWHIKRHLKRLEDRVNTCEEDRESLRKEMKANQVILDDLKAVFLRGSCGIFSCDVRKRMTAEEVRDRLSEMGTKTK